MFDDQAQDVLHQGLPAGLTPSEYRLLATLREHAGEALSKPFLYRSVLHRSYTRLDRGLDVHVCNLRRKLTAVAVRHLQIQAVRGQGYLLVETEHPDAQAPAVMETGAAAGQLLPAADLADLHLGPVGGAQHPLLAPPDRSYLADYARQAEDAWRSEGAAGAERFRKEPSAKEDTRGAGRTAPGKPRQHAAKHRGVEPPDLHASSTGR